MKNNRLKILLSVLTLVLVSLGDNAFAAKATFSPSNKNDIRIAAEGYPCNKPGGAKCINGNKKNPAYDAHIAYNDPNINVKFEGKTYPAYCIDPNLAMSGRDELTCTPYFHDAGMNYLFAQIDARNLDHTTFLLALRWYASAIGLNIGKGLTGPKAAMIRYWQIRFDNGNQGVYEDTGYGDLSQLQNAWERFVWGTNDRSQQQIETAYQLAVESVRVHQSNPIPADPESPDYAEVTFGKPIRNGNSMTYPVTSSNYIEPAKMKFVCDAGCTITGTPVWNGTSGTVTVTATACDEEFTLTADYGATGGVYTCTTNSIATQTLMVYVEADDNQPGTGLGGAQVTGVIPCDGKCCTEKPIEPGHIEGEIFNCCTDNTTSEAHEYNLNDLFCYDNDLKVDHYYTKCGTDYYDITDETKLNAEYCKMYCTERVSVEIPGAITATSGRYFKLQTTSKGTKSPYIEGFKRCRILVDYKKWEKDYGKQVENQVKQYNEFQKQEAWRLTYKDAVDAKMPGSTSGTSIECTRKCSDSDTWCVSTDPKTGKCDDWDSCHASVDESYSPSCTLVYTRYPFRTTYDWYGIKINDPKRQNYTAYEILSKGGKQGTTYAMHSDKWSSDNIDESDCTSKFVSGSKTDTDGRCSCTASWSCKVVQNEVHSHKEDVPGKLSNYTGAANAAETAYNAAADKAKKLEEDLDRCDNYFTKYEGANPDENFKFQSSMEFYYTQVYLDETGERKLDEQYVTFEETPGCVVYPPTVGPDSVDHLEGKGYSAIYSASGNIEILEDLKRTDLKHHPNGPVLSEIRDVKYNADKLFRHDAKYRAECSWNEGENKYHTLVPNGSASESTDGINFTEHGREYRVYLTTFDGTYETYWDIQGLGTDGMFDDYFRENGTNTCSNQSPSDTSMMTCKLHVEYEIVLTGYCNGSNGSDTTTRVEDCEPYKEGMDLFNFRVVDPVELFPSGTTKEGKEFAHNWIKEDKGVVARKEIQERAKIDKTYAPSQVTYSFTLTPTDMQHIKNYNQERINYGGYSDFELDCSCGTACNMCKSRFVDALSKGHVKYDSREHDVTGWTNKNSTLTQVRDRLLR